MTSIKYVSVLLLAVSVFVFSSEEQIEAQSTPVSGSYDMYLYEVHGYADIIEQNDYFIMLRYDLPYINSSGTITNTFCNTEFLDDTAGCELTPPKPTEGAVNPICKPKLLFKTSGTPGNALLPKITVLDIPPTSAL